MMMEQLSSSICGTMDGQKLIHHYRLLVGKLRSYGLIKWDEDIVNNAAVAPGLIRTFFDYKIKKKRTL